MKGRTMNASYCSSWLNSEQGRYGEKPSQKEIDEVLVKANEEQIFLNTIKRELAEMKVGNWLVYRGREDTISPPIGMLAIGIKGKFEFYLKENNCYVKRVK